MATITKRDLYDQSNMKHLQSYEDWIKGESVSGHRYLDDSYLAEIEQYKDKPWYDYLLTNPWLAGNQRSFSPTFWQSLAEDFGDYSARDAYNAELASNRSQWLSEFIEKMRQQDYNSPLEQVQREKLAGLNPDLNGNVDSGAAAENDQPINPVQMQPPGQNGISGLGNFASSLLSNIMGLAESFQNLKMNNLNMVSQELSNNDSAIDLVVKSIAGSSHFKSADDIDNIPAEELGDLILDASQKFDYSRYSSSTRKIIKSLFGQYSRDKKSGKYPLAVEALRSELRNRFASNTSSAVKASSSPLFNEDFDEFLSEYSKIVGKAEYESYMASLKSSKSKSDYDSRYFHGLDASKQSKAENDEADQRSVMARQQAITEGLYKDLYELFKNSNSWYGNAGLILLPLVRGLVQNMSFGLGRYGKSGKFGFTGINF